MKHILFHAVMKTLTFGALKLIKTVSKWSLKVFLSLKAILRECVSFGKKTGFFSGFDFRAPMDFFHGTFFKPTLQIEIC